jgi:NitT/TauT family transport system substrate-binding protein
MRRAFASLLLAVAAAFSVVGCGGGTPSVGSNGGQATVKVGVLPIADVAPLYLGMQQGFFKQQKLTIKPQILEGGAAVTAAVVSGKLDFGFSATEPLTVARSKGLPVQIVSQGDQAAPSIAKAWDGLMVRPNGPIKSPKDLEGKTIAVNALSSMNELCTKAVLERDGVDVSKVKFLEVQFPDQVGALQAKRVDAISAVEPFVSQAKAAGARSLFSYFAGLQPKLTVATYFATTPFIKKNTDVVTRFAKAMNKSLAYAQSHPDEARKAVLSYTKIPPKAAQKMNLPYWSTNLNEPSIQLVANYTKHFGYAKTLPSMNELIWSGATAAGAQSGT